MKSIVLAGAAAALCSFAATQAQAQIFEGPSVGVEAGYEDYDGAEGETIALHAGWDFSAAPNWIVGASLRATLDGVADGQTEALGVNIATTRVAIEDQWSLAARAGHVFDNAVLVFGEVGYEQFHVNAVRDLRAQVCAPPSGCLISRLDGSFDEDMVTYAAGAEWAITDNWRLRGTYTYGDSDAFERNRFGVSAHFQF
jgi:opacity protein-like surface antigen